MCVFVCVSRGKYISRKSNHKRIDLDEQNNEMILYAMGENVFVLVVRVCVCVCRVKEEGNRVFREENSKMRIIPHKR